MTQFPFGRPDAFAAPAEFAMLREREPVARVEVAEVGPVWLVTGYDDVRRVLTDGRFGLEPPGEAGSNDSLFQDPPGHDRLRRLVAKAFTPRYVAEMRVRIDETVSSLVARMSDMDGPVDLLETLAIPLPITVIGELLGITEQDRKPFRDKVDAMVALDPMTPEGGQAWAELHAYVDGLIAAKRAEPGEDLLSMLITIHDDGDHFSEAELATMMIALLLAGYASTAHAITIGTVLLLDNGQYAALSRDPELVGPAVEEILRCQTGRNAEAMPRIAHEDVQLGGVHIRTGDRVLASLEAANHDPARFPDPHRFDITREPNPHLSFGHGPHHCLGAALARMELRAAFASLTSNFPELRLAKPSSELAWRKVFVDEGPSELPVRW